MGTVVFVDATEVVRYEEIELTRLEGAVVAELLFGDLKGFLFEEGAIVGVVCLWDEVREEVCCGEPKDEHFWVAVQCFSILVEVRVTVTVSVCLHQRASAPMA